MAAKLDVAAECERLWFYQGATLAGLGTKAVERQTLEALWKLFPFIKALCRVGQAHEAELLVAWEEELQKPMPFGLPPVGLPKEEP